MKINVFIISLFACLFLISCKEENDLGKNSCLIENPLTETNNTDQSAIIGKWKLVKTASGRTAEGIITHTCATIAVVFEFKSDYILTIQCLRPGNDCIPYRNGDYSYLFHVNGDNETQIQIGNDSWWYHISENELILSKAPVDGGSYFFERM